MKKPAHEIARRRFTKEFKQARVKEYERGEVSVKEISRLYHVSYQSVYKWLHKYSYFYKNNIVVVEEQESVSKKLAEAEKRISDLERSLGQKQIKVDYLEEIINTAGSHLGIDLKKSLNTKRSKNFVADDTK